MCVVAYLHYFCTTQSLVNCTCVSKDSHTPGLSKSQYEFFFNSSFSSDGRRSSRGSICSRSSIHSALSSIRRSKFLFFPAAASTSLQKTQSAITSASVTAERPSAELTSQGLPVLSDHSQGKQLAVAHSTQLVSTVLLLLADLYHVRGF